MVLRAPKAVPVGLVLPSYVGYARYGPPPGSEEDRRPLLYREDDGERPITIGNAIDLHWRIPLDELRDMTQEARRRRVTRGDAQRRADTDRMLREWWADRQGWQWDRRNGRVSVGPATFAGNVRHKGAK